MIRDVEVNRKRWVTVELRKSRAKRVIDIYVKMILSGKTDLNKLAEMYRPDSLKPTATLQRLLKQIEVKQVIANKLDEALRLHGIDVDFVLKKEKEIFNAAKKKEDYTNVIKILNNWRESLDMKPINSKITVTEETNYKALLEDNQPERIGQEDG